MALTLVVALIMLSGILTVSADCDVQTKEVLEGLVKEMQFEQVKHVDGSSYCATDTPAVSLPLGQNSDASASLVQCALYCQSKDGCVGFNYVSDLLSDGTQCQLFTKFTKGCKKNVDTSCRYYEVPGSSLACTDASAFTYDSAHQTYFLASSDLKTWNDAATACASFGPQSHLAVFRDSGDYSAFKTFAEASETSASCAAIDDYLGYWIALRRQTQSCSSTEWIWDINNSPTGAISSAAANWPLPWISGQPDCAGSAEFFTNVAIKKGYLFNDAGPWSIGLKQCYICQIFG